MKTSAPNILNLLLGIAPVPSGGTQAVADNPLDMLFGEVMQTVLGQEQIPRVGGQAGLFGRVESKIPTTGPAPQFALPQTRTMAPANVLTPQTSPATGSADFVSGTSSKIPGWDFEGIEIVEIVESVPMALSSKAVSLTGIRDEFTPPAADQPSAVDPAGGAMPGTPTATIDPLVSAQIQRLLVSAGGQLPIGSYTVADYRVTDGQLTLDLVPEETPDTMIRVTLPLAALTNSLSTSEGVSTGAARVALDSTAPQLSLRTLFNDLRLKELVVKPAETTIPTINTPLGGSVNQAADRVTPVEFKLFAENAGQEVVIKANLGRNDLRTRVMVGEQPRSTAAVPDQSTESLAPLTTRPATRVSGISRDGSIDDLLSSATPRSKFQGLAGNESSSAKTSGEGIQGLPDFARSSTELTMPRERLDTAAVRYTLPQEARQMLKSNGQSVQLRIDPEHLGPARLNLTMQNDQLRAVVVVDSPQARQAVEGSLDRLVEALQRADIKVDYIQVTVDQQGTRNELFGQHEPRWTKPSRMQRFPGLDNEITSPATMTAVPMARSSYIGAGGVNVLA